MGGRTHARLLGRGGRDRAALGALGVGGEAAAVVAVERAGVDADPAYAKTTTPVLIFISIMILISPGAPPGP
jgi:hypothetical protein